MRIIEALTAYMMAHNIGGRIRDSKRKFERIPAQRAGQWKAQSVKNLVMRYWRLTRRRLLHPLQEIPNASAPRLCCYFTPETQQSFFCGGGILFFSQQRGFGACMPGLT